MPPVSQARRAEEVLPFGIASLGRQVTSEAGKLFLLDPEDPVLAKLAHENPHRLYQRLGITDATVAGCWRQITDCLLAYPIELLPASSRQGYGRTPSRAQLRMHRYCQSALDQVPMWETIKVRALDAYAWGWRPFELTYARDLYVMGTRYWRPATIRDKEPSLFRFNANRELVYLGSGEMLVFDQADDPARWWLCQSGSTDCPYGVGLFQAAWLPAYMKSQYLKLWKSRLTRNNGVLNVTGPPAPDIDLTNPEKAVRARQNAQQALEYGKSIAKSLDEDGILVTSGIFKVELDKGLITSADSYEGPISYLDGLISLVLLGQQLTSAQAKDISSRSATEVGRKGVIDRARGAGAALVEMLNVLTGMMCTLNFGEGADKADFPYWRCGIDRTSKLDDAAKLVAMGAVIDGRPLAEDAGIALAEPGEPGALQGVKATIAPTSDATKGDAQNAGDAATGDQDAGGA